MQVQMHLQHDRARLNLRRAPLHYELENAVLTEVDSYGLYFNKPGRYCWHWEHCTIAIIWRATAGFRNMLSGYHDKITCIPDRDESLKCLKAIIARKISINYTGAKPIKRSRANSFWSHVKMVTWSIIKAWITWYRHQHAIWCSHYKDKRKNSALPTLFLWTIPTEIGVIWGLDICMLSLQTYT